MSNKTLTKEVAYHVKKAMKKHNITTEFIAKNVHLSTSTVYNILEERPVALESLLLVLSFLNIELEVKTL